MNAGAAGAGGGGGRATTGPCALVREAVAEGRSLDGAELRLHLETCAPCRELAASAAVLRGSLTTPPDTSALLGSLERALAEEDRAPLAWLRSRPTWLRRLLALLAIASTALLVFAVRPRADLDSYPTLRLLVEVLLLACLLSGSAALALRPAYRPLLATSLYLALPGALVLLVLVLAVLPVPAPTPSAPDLLASAMPCLRFGALLGLPSYALLRALDHTQSRLLAVSAAAAAGGLGHLSLHMHCANTDRGHLLLGHAGVVVLFVLAALLALAWARRAAR